MHWFSRCGMLVQSPHPENLYSQQWAVFRAQIWLQARRRSPEFSASPMSAFGQKRTLSVKPRFERAASTLPFDA